MAFSPESNQNPQPGGVPSFTESQTLSFLQEHGVEPLDFESWKPHQPLLYLLEEVTRSSGPNRFLGEERLPSIARIDDPTFIDLHEPRGDEDSRRGFVYRLGNDGGRVDYYAIDGVTKKPVLVRTSNPVKTLHNAYFVRKETLFRVNDALFPRGE